ncbi:hypothetical protein AMECASPLE_006230 [Ameca splendens]|uniref:Uncharacterized protein n=1 Tax=Ameca splendens TaxID=208324 RepID=A0ABV0ZV98_9TELE
MNESAVMSVTNAAPTPSSFESLLPLKVAFPFMIREPKQAQATSFRQAYFCVWVKEVFIHCELGVSFSTFNSLFLLVIVSLLSRASINIPGRFQCSGEASVT